MECSKNSLGLWNSLVSWNLFLHFCPVWASRTRTLNRKHDRYILIGRTLIICIDMVLEQLVRQYQSSFGKIARGVTQGCKYSMLLSSQLNREGFIMHHHSSTFLWRTKLSKCSRMGPQLSWLDGSCTWKRLFWN